MIHLPPCPSFLIEQVLHWGLMKEHMLDLHDSLTDQGRTIVAKLLVIWEDG